MVIVCIDDDVDDLDVLCEAIRRVDSNCICHMANNGDLGLKLVKKVNPDFIFLDINMPVMDGKKILQAIRRDDGLNKIPVCIHSTTVTSKEKDCLMSMGANYCIQKANSFDDLCATLKMLLHIKEPI